MALSNLFITEIEDEYIQENFRKIIAEFSTVFVLKNLRFVEISVTGNAANVKYPHNLHFLPKDVIQTSKLGTGTWVWNYGSFTKTDLVFTVSGAASTDVTTVRALVGNLEERNAI